MIERPTSEEIDGLFARLNSEAEAGGYHLNPDEEFTRDLIEALLTNTQRYGYQSCPCRLADGIRDQDLDIICPCDYRDPDLTEFGACYCSLYVSRDIADGKAEAEPIPERRPGREERMKPPDTETRRHGDTEGVSDAGKRGRGEEGGKPDGATGRLGDGEKELPYPVWRCPVCGYLCARDEPPEKCPICKADKDRFMRFL